MPNGRGELQGDTLREKLRRKKFVITVEMEPPRGPGVGEVLERVSRLKGLVDAVNVADCPMANLRMSPIAVAHLIQEQLGLETIFHLTCRDRNLMGLQAELLGAAALGVRNILALTGDKPQSGDHPMATGVFDVDGVGLISLAAGLNQGRTWAGHQLSAGTDLFIGSVANPGNPDLEKETERLKAKAQAGADFFQTQPVFNLDGFSAFRSRAEALGITVLYGILPLKSLKNAMYLNEHVPGMRIPREILGRMEAGGEGEGVRIAREMLETLRAEGVSGVHIFPMGNPEVVRSVVEGQG